ncbi:hypothetical protein [Paraburkholderia domus]|uniref:hypothetical protein n=1 Tax=Paraburkholderia domus TaxID=2793075 RepID=UPI00191347E4|nr:hypothetical protein [Paraburkholderia domus]MBK5066367.1 hypothetical protein [Burkholderia sp. R-70199]CAE6969688.1 hypothetical protein R70199_08102 [Paraburkholderia domus]
MNLLDVLAFVLVAFLTGFVLREFLPGYFRKKGENLATKQDIAEITSAQKAVEHRFNELIEDSRQRHALRTLVAEKRMEAHQHAFLRVKQLLFARQDTVVIAQCRDWMDANCLYLNGDARLAVWKAVGHAETRAQHLTDAENAAGDHEHVKIFHEEATKAWNGIMAALPPIVAAVELPALGAEELQVFVKGTETA